MHQHQSAIKKFIKILIFDIFIDRLKLLWYVADKLEKTIILIQILDFKDWFFYNQKNVLCNQWTSRFSLKEGRFDLMSFHRKLSALLTLFIKDKFSDERISIIEDCLGRGFVKQQLNFVSTIRTKILKSSHTFFVWNKLEPSPLTISTKTL